MDLYTLTLSLFASSLTAKVIYIAAGLLPKLEVAEIERDLNEYLGAVEVPDAEMKQCEFTMLSKHSLYWLPLVAPFIKGPYTKQTGMAKYEVFILELLAIAFVVGAYKLNTDIVALLFSGMLISLSLTAILVDSSSRFLPDKIVYPLLWVGLLFSTTQHALVTPSEAINGALIAYFSMYCFNKVTYLKSGQDSLAWGDVRLVAAFGAWLGTSLVVPMITACFVSLLFIKKGAAFGPIIVIWAYIAIGGRLLGII